VRGGVAAAGREIKAGHPTGGSAIFVRLRPTAGKDASSRKLEKFNRLGDLLRRSGPGKQKEPGGQFFGCLSRSADCRGLVPPESQPVKRREKMPIPAGGKNSGLRGGGPERQFFPRSLGKNPPEVSRIWVKILKGRRFWQTGRISSGQELAAGACQPRGREGHREAGRGGSFLPVFLGESDSAASHFSSKLRERRQIPHCKKFMTEGRFRVDGANGGPYNTTTERGAALAGRSMQVDVSLTPLFDE